jgi:hypothetical protein
MADKKKMFEEDEDEGNINIYNHVILLTDYNAKPVDDVYNYPNPG